VQFPAFATRSQGLLPLGLGLELELGVKIRVKLRLLTLEECREWRPLGMATPGNGGPESRKHRTISLNPYNSMFRVLYLQV